MAVITISRQYGTGGVRIGRSLAEKINYRFFYVSELAQECKKRGLDIDLERIEGRAPRLLERIFGMNRDKVSDTIRDVLVETANAGDVVICGWGGQVFLKNQPDTLHIRIVGSLESRIRYLVESSGVPRSTVEDLIANSDRNQGLFSHYFFDVDFADPKLYHAVINIDHIQREDFNDIISLMLPKAVS
jgi:cytidylate kinase